MPRKNWKPKGQNKKKGYRRFLCAPRKGCGPFRNLADSSHAQEKHPVNHSSFFEVPVSDIPAINYLEVLGADDPALFSIDDMSTGDAADPVSFPSVPLLPLHPMTSNSPEEDINGFKGFDVPPLTEQGVRVLSLFDGIGAAKVALDNVGINVIEYFSSEVDEKALSVLKYHHFNKINMVGCVKKLTQDKLSSFGPIHLLLGGSPCSDLSLCNPARRGLHGKNSTGQLFFEFKRILDILSAHAKQNSTSFYWLFENTFSMENSSRDEISRNLCCEPVVRCASSYVPMKRRRYFWGNIPQLYSGGADVCKHHLQDYLKPYRTATVASLPTITGTRHSQLCGRQKEYPVTEEGQESFLFISEEEQLFGFPEHYTDCGISISDRRRLLGQSWCVPVIMDILNPLAVKLREL